MMHVRDDGKTKYPMRARRRRRRSSAKMADTAVLVAVLGLVIIGGVASILDVITLI
jgi:hypothetical protein